MAPAHDPPSRERAPGARRILVAEDNPANRRLLDWQITLLGYDADICGHGALALTWWKARDYDLMITDLHMPIMDGYELASASDLTETKGTHGQAEDFADGADRVPHGAFGRAGEMAASESAGPHDARDLGRTAAD